MLVSFAAAVQGGLSLASEVTEEKRELQLGQAVCQPILISVACSSPFLKLAQRRI